MIAVAVMTPVALTMILAVIAVAFLMARMLITLMCGCLMLGMAGHARRVFLMVPGMLRRGIHPPNIYP